MIVSFRFWAGPDDPKSVVMRTAEKPLVDARGLTVDGEVTDGDGIFACGPAVIFVPLRQLLWSVVREDRP